VELVGSLAEGARIAGRPDKFRLDSRWNFQPDGKLVGAVLFGDTADSLWYLDLMRSGRPVDAMRHTLAFGRALAERKAA